MKVFLKEGGQAGHAVILLGHGSALDEANEILRATARALQERHGFAVVETAFLLLAEPGFCQTLEGLIERGYRDITVMPYFLSCGAHVAKEIPAEVALVRKKYPNLRIRITESLGFHEKIVDIVEQRLTEALGEEVDNKTVNGSRPIKGEGP